MHPNPNFRDTDPARVSQTAAAVGFGTLTINSEQGPLAAHVPFYIEGQSLFAHLLRSNPILKQLKPSQPALMSVVASDAYISPDWYVAQDQVPTWNYVAVSLRGPLKALPPDQLEEILAKTSAKFEGRLTDKMPWTMDKMQAKTRQSMMRAIVPVELEIEAYDGTWKLNQNKTAEDRRGVITALGTDHPIAKLMAEDLN